MSDRTLHTVLMFYDWVKDAHRTGDYRKAQNRIAEVLHYSYGEKWSTAYKMADEAIAKTPKPPPPRKPSFWRRLFG